MSKRNYQRGMVMLVVTLLCATWCGGAFPQAQKVPDTVPRIALIGDSWGMFMWWFRSFREALDSGDFPGCENYTEVAYDTVIGGSKAYQFVNVEQFPAAANIMQNIADMFNDYPTLDVAVISLGGNDVLYGTEYVLPGSPETEVRAQCPGTPNEHNALLLDKVVTQDLSDLIDFILALRPDIRIIITSYDYGGTKKRSECDLETQQLGIMLFDIAKQQLAEEKGDRVFFISNYGLMQYTWGTFDYSYDESGEQAIDDGSPPIYDAGYVKPGFVPSDYPPVILPEPDDYWATPWTAGGLEVNIPGFPEYHSPLDSLIDRNMHLSKDGYYVMAHRMLEKFVAEWLNYPKVLEILPLSSILPDQYRFQVTFSQAVSGVDASDFEIAAFSGKTRLNVSKADIISITPASGYNTVYNVTVDMNSGKRKAGSDAFIQIHVLDDDSIIDEYGTPLGGANTATWTDNSKFTFNGTWSFTEFERPESGNLSEAQYYLGVLLNPYRPLINYAAGFAEDQLDINGDIMELLTALLSKADLARLDFSKADIDIDTLYIPGNGILESFEFALISYPIEHNVDFSGNTITWNEASYPGISSALIQQDWAANVEKMQTALGGTENNIALEVLAGIETVLAGYMTLGDPEFMSVVGILTWFLSTDEGVQEFLPGVEFGNVSPGDFTGHPEWFSPDADIDADGYTNGEEYLYFECDGKEAYAAAAYSASLKPQPLKAAYEAGDSVRLYVPEYLHASTVYQWYKDGEAIADGGFISGASSRTLNILSLTEADSGSYTCEWDDQNPNGKSTGVYGPVTLNVVAELPLVGGFGLSGLAAVVLLGGAASLIRRRKYSG